MPKYNKYGYDPQQDDNEGQQQSQESVILSAYDRKIIHKLFRNTLEWFEKYIEVVYSEYYPNWRYKKQIHDNSIKRQDANDPKKIESLFSSILFGFKKMSEDKPKFLLDELKKEYYEWLDVTGVDINDCPPRLKNFLFEVNEVLEGRGEKLERDTANKKREIHPNSPEYGEALNKMFSGIQNPLENARNEFKSLEGKTYKDIKVGNNFGGNSEKAEQVFKQMVGQHDYQEFNFFPQQVQNPNYSELIDDPMDEFETSSSPAGSSSKKNPQQRTNSGII